MLINRKSHFLLIFLFLLAGIAGFHKAAALTEEEKNNIAVYQKASLSVVNITSTIIARDFLFAPIPEEGSGSGSIIDSRGYILTNNHVIQDAQKLEVTLLDGSKWPATMVGADPENDLAVIKINAPDSKIKPISMSDSQKLQVGQKVLAIGNPFGLGITLTTGIISSLGRTIRSEMGTMIDEVIQIDATINPGNSGGPLLNSDGEMIGINSAIISPTGASVGIGFSIPVNTAKKVIPDLINKGYVTRAFLGVTVQPVNSDTAKFLGLKIEKGAMVIDVSPGSPAENAGLKGGNRQVQMGNSQLIAGGDIITRLNEIEIKDAEGLVKNLRDRKPGEVINLGINRDGKEMELKVTLQEKPKDSNR